MTNSCTQIEWGKSTWIGGKRQERLYTLRWHCEWLLQQHNGFVKKKKKGAEILCLLFSHEALLVLFIPRPFIVQSRTKFVAMPLHDRLTTMAGQYSNTRISWWYLKDTFEYLYFSIKINLKNVFVSQLWNTFTVYCIYRYSSKCEYLVNLSLWRRRRPHFFLFGWSHTTCFPIPYLFLSLFVSLCGQYF